jgi:hypothetical protein
VDELRRHYEEIPGYRLLVIYLKRFTLQQASRYRDLTPTERAAVRAFDWRVSLEQAIRHLDAAEQIVARVSHQRDMLEQTRSGGRRPRPSAFVLALAWVLMAKENQTAARDPRVAAVVTRLSHSYGCSEQGLLNWSFLPREIPALLDVRLTGPFDRRVDANKVRRLRALQNLDRPIPRELEGLDTTDRRQDNRWWADLGLDKESGSLSRQRLWTRIIVPLFDEMGAKTADVFYRRLALDVSHLLRVRYPDLKTPGPEQLRSRYNESR